MLAAYAARINADDPLSGLELGQRPEPEDRPGWTTVTVKAASLFGSGTTYDVNSGIFDFSGTGSVTLASIDAAIDNVSKTRSTFGSVQNRLEHTLNNLASYEENLSASESRIKDVDMASEMVNFTKYQILQSAGTSMLAQANSSPQSVLKLLG